MTNKTLIQPSINVGTSDQQEIINLPTSADTLIGRNTTDTLTNKTLEIPTINEATINEAVSISTKSITKIFEVTLHEELESAPPIREIKIDNVRKPVLNLVVGTKYIFDYSLIQGSPTIYLMKSLPFQYGGNIDNNFSDSNELTTDSRVSITKDTSNKRVSIELTNLSYSTIYYGLFLNSNLYIGNIINVSGIGLLTTNNIFGSGQNLANYSSVELNYGTISSDDEDDVDYSEICMKTDKKARVIIGNCEPDSKESTLVGIGYNDFKEVKN